MSFSSLSIPTPGLIVSVLALTAPLPPPSPLQLAAHQLLQWIFPNMNANGATSLLDTSSLSPAPQGRVNVLGTMGKAGHGKAMEED